MLLASLIGGAQGGAAAAQRSASVCKDGDVVAVDAATRARAATAIRCLVNRERGRRGARTLKRSLPLDRAARAHSASMVKHKYLSHVGRDGANLRRRVARTGYSRSGQRYFVSETITFVTGDRRTANGVFEELLLSAQHRERIRRALFRDLGVGLSIGAPKQTTRPGVTLVLVLGVRG